jgi:hypothetical protein
VAQANNASFAALGAYEDWVPAFVSMHQQAGGDWPRFYDAVRALARLPAAQRQAALCAALPPLHRIPTVSDIQIDRPHTLGLPTARQHARLWADKAQAKFGVECRYEEGASTMCCTSAATASTASCM